MSLEQIATLEQANRFLEMTFWPDWQQRFAVPPAAASNAHRSLGHSHRLEEILSVRVARTVAADHTVSWQGQRWGLRREDVCAGMRGAHAEIEPRLARSHSPRFPRPHLHLHYQSPAGLKGLFRVWLPLCLPAFAAVTVTVYA